MKNGNPESARNRRAFLRGSLVTGAAIAGATVLGGRKLFAQTSLSGQTSLLSRTSSGSLTKGDAAILRFLAAAELIESDLWTQYAELGGIGDNPPIEIDPHEHLNNYQVALSNLDSDGPQYITSNTLDEVSHATFLNAYLESRGAEPVNFDKFRTLPGSTAKGSSGIKRLTNLMHLNVDTSWYVRYRSATNPDFGATFPQALTLKNVTAIPRNNNDFNGASNPNFRGNDHVQVIANVAGFHFGYIEQGGSSLYAAMSQKVSEPEVLEITLGIGGDEIVALSGMGRFFGQWRARACGAVYRPDIRPVVSQFFTKPPLQPASLVQPSLIFPVPCEFISPDLPHVSVIRPLTDKFGGAVATIASFTKDGLFVGQTPEFFQVVHQLAQAADAATRQF